MKGKIELRGLEFHAFHGCLPEERENGNLFVVDFSGVCDVDAAAERRWLSPPILSSTRVRVSCVR